MRVRERLAQTRSLLAAMVLIQVLWLGRKWLLGDALGIILACLFYAVVVGIAIGVMPAGLVSRLRQSKEHLLRNDKILITTLGVFVLVAGLSYATYFRVSPDEAKNLAASRIVALEGVAPFFANYGQHPWLGYQHPPLVPLAHGLVMRVLGVNLFVMRFVTLLLGLSVILITYSLGRELYDRYTGFLAASLLLSFPLFLRVGILANNDMPVTFCFAFALLLILYSLRGPTNRLSVAAGLIIGAGLLSKYTMVLIFVVLIGSFLIIGRFRRLGLHLGIIGLVSLGVLAFWLVYAYRADVLAAHWDKVAAYAGASTTTGGGGRFFSSWRMQFRLDALVETLPYSLGIFNIPVLFLGGLHFIRRRSQSDRFVLLWIAAVFLPVILTLPVNRYFIPAFPALAIVMAVGLRCIPQSAEQVLMLALLYAGQALYLDIALYQVIRPYFQSALP